jgi:hypothetical protein
MIKLEDKPNVIPPDSTYPFGNIKDNNGSGNGTPLNELVHADFHQFFAKMFYESGLTSNGLKDNAANGFQYFQALIDVLHKNISLDIVTGLWGKFIEEPFVVILWGVNIQATIPGLSFISPGAVYYAGKIYKVPNATVTTSGSETLVFYINETVQPGFVEVKNGLSGTGIADYNGSVVKRIEGDWVELSGFSTGYSTASNKAKVRYNSLTKRIEFKGWINFASPSTTLILQLPPNVWPAFNQSGSMLIKSWDGAFTGRIFAQSNGDLLLDAIPGGSTDTITLDSFSYFL